MLTLGYAHSDLSTRAKVQRNHHRLVITEYGLKTEEGKNQISLSRH